MTWREMGKCFGTYDDRFFPPSTEDGISGVKVAQEAKAICVPCQVIDDCLAYALTTRPTYGIWGGRTVRELRGMRT